MPSAIERCACCGSTAIAYAPVLWPALAEAWRLTNDEIAYINRQQGCYCATCVTNLRSMALARAIMGWVGYDGVFADFVTHERAQSLRVLEVNRAGDLTRWLERLPLHALTEYPAVDMTHLPFPDGVFDLVVHSDTLEHVEHPDQGLAECYRVLAPGGACAFTVPIIVGRLTMPRAGMPPSYHGDAARDRGDYLVQTEFGSDAWTLVIRASFDECRICTLDYPAGIALVGVKRP